MANKWALLFNLTIKNRQELAHTHTLAHTHRSVDTKKYACVFRTLHSAVIKIQI